MIQEIYIIDDKNQFIDQLKRVFNDKPEYHFVSVKSNELETVLKNIPTMIIVEDDDTELNAVEICKQIRNNEDNTITPVIVLSSVANHEYRLEILRMSIQYYILKPINEDYFRCTVENMIDFISTNRRISPLTRIAR